MWHVLFLKTDYQKNCMDTLLFDQPIDVELFKGCELMPTIVLVCVCCMDHISIPYSGWLNGASCLKSTNCLSHCDNEAQPFRGLAPAATDTTEVVSQQECCFDVTRACVCV